MRSDGLHVLELVPELSDTNVTDVSADPVTVGAITTEPEIRYAGYGLLTWGLLYLC